MLSSAAFERILKRAGAKRVSEEAAKELANVVEQKLLEVAKEAVALAKHAGRKTVIDADIRLARKNLGV
jgi:histone H3/H4